jgi:hypothetical protein
MKKEHTCRVWGQPYWNEDDEVFDDLWTEHDVQFNETAEQIAEQHKKPNNRLVFVMQITAQGTEEEIEDTIDSFEDLVNWFTYDSNNYQRSDDDGFEDTLEGCFEETFPNHKDLRTYNYDN